MALATKLRSLLNQSQTAVRDFHNAVDGLQQEIATLQAKRASIQAAPVPIDEAIEGLDRWLERKTKDAVGNLWIGNLVHGRGGLEINPEVGGFDLLLAANREAIRDLTLQKLKESYAGQTGIPRDDREQQLDAIDEQQVQLELAEERAIREAERLGIVIDRREDVSPEVALAVDEELEG